jgi:NAD(P)-dependent dehydrogenase (short-subunit alcohol dehydrogenase family)/acyl carrier protein
MALKAAEEIDWETVEELTLQAPLVIPARGAVSLQVSVAGLDEAGKRPMAIHSRTETEGELGEWTLHATGVLQAEAKDAPEPLSAWPPDGAELLDTSDLYERLAEIGFHYGPAFQGVSRAWHSGEEVYAEVSLGDDAQLEEAGRFGVHPALLDSTFHAGIALALTDSEGGKPILPFAWRGVRVIAGGPSFLRVRVLMRDEHLELLAADQNGMPVLEVDSLVGRPVEQSQLAAKNQGSLYRVEWQGIPLPEAPDSRQATLLDTRSWAQGETVEASHALTARALEQIQAHLAGEETAEARLVFLTEGGLNEGEGSEARLPASTLAGLLRSAYSEHPGRFALIDTDGSEASTQALESAIAATADEPQVALREGEALVPRFAEAQLDGEPDAEPAASLDPEKTILITGATGGLGAAIARHLASHHGAHRLLLVSRSGEAAPGAAELRAELEEIGAQTTIAACDVSDRDQLEQLLGSIPAEHPLGAVIHAAGVFDNGLIPDLDAERLRAVMAPKVDAAWHLHELTAGADLSHFVLFSSAAGLLGGPGQGNYAAANAFLDALAAQRRELDLPATSLAWGLWAQETNLVGEVSEAEIERLLRQTRMLLGFSPIPPEQGLGLFDNALSHHDSLLAPVLFDRPALRAQAKAGSLAAPLRGLVRLPKSLERAGDVLASRLAAVPEAEREAFVLDFVRTEVAAVLGHDSAAAIEPERAFKDLGFDSLAAVELRNRLVAGTGVQLPATMAFDYPNAGALARHLLDKVDITAGDARNAETQIDQLASTISADSLAASDRTELAARLRALALDLEGGDREDQIGSERDRLEAASDDELLEALDDLAGQA